MEVRREMPLDTAGRKGGCKSGEGSESKGTQKQRQRQLFWAAVAPVILVLSITNYRSNARPFRRPFSPPRSGMAAPRRLSDYAVVGTIIVGDSNLRSLLVL